MSYNTCIGLLPRREVDLKHEIPTPYGVFEFRITNAYCVDDHKEGWASAVKFRSRRGTPVAQLVNRQTSYEAATEFVQSFLSLCQTHLTTRQGWPSSAPTLPEFKPFANTVHTFINSIPEESDMKMDYDDDDGYEFDQIMDEAMNALDTTMNTLDISVKELTEEMNDRTMMFYNNTYKESSDMGVSKQVKKSSSVARGSRASKEDGAVGFGSSSRGAAVGARSKPVTPSPRIDAELAARNTRAREAAAIPKREGAFAALIKSGSTAFETWKRNTFKCKHKFDINQPPETWCCEKCGEKIDV